MKPPEELAKLVDRFANNREAYCSGEYKETQLRREFIDPFFAALGWDVDNKAGFAETYKEVIHEDAIRIRGQVSAPDYCFRIGGQRKFFVEAKKPSVDIKGDFAPSFQLRRYAWSAKLPLSILTDFEEFAVYDCRVRPAKSDKASTARVSYITFEEYEDRWDEIASAFSKQAILKGSFDKYADDSRRKRGTAEVDGAFLDEIESWRDMLAHNIALRNPKLSKDDLNFAVQRTIDRIVFLRICEDRGIEDYGRLMKVLNGQNIYARLMQEFVRADNKYNSGLFHFTRERDRAEGVDELTPKLDVDDKPLKEIVRNLYYPESPYQFSVLPADILGQVYEQFLGKVISLTPGHRAVVDYRPEVKKAGGVYYTPKYIVDYIVKNTVGKLLEGKTPKQAAKLRILDPACGSGSFLIGAYQYLLDWHLQWYLKDGPEGHCKGKSAALVKVREKDWRLTTQERKRILLNNIFGMDIDTAAVEVTKLSLLLKVLEGETEQSLKQLPLFHERALPDLGNNIKCGNSLIAPDYFDGKEQPGDEDMKRINPFDWAKEFPEAQSTGGFDAVIGNPPYIRIQNMQEWAPLEVEIYKDLYDSAKVGNYDIYVVFAEKGLSLLRKGGLLGFILPNKFFNAQYGEGLRKILSEGRHLSGVVHFGDQQVFAGATTYTCLMFLEKAGVKECQFRKVADLSDWRTNGTAEEGSISVKKITASEWNFAAGASARLFERLDQMPAKLATVADRIFQGLVTGADPVFILTDAGRGNYYSDARGKDYLIEKELMHPLCKGSVNIRRYGVDGVTKSILFPYRLVKGKAELISSKEFPKEFPRAWRYLVDNRDALEARERAKWKHDRWYAFGRSQNLSEMEQTKLLTPSIAKKASFTLDSKGYYYFVGSGGGGGGGYGVTLKSEVKLAYEYLLGLLNSRLLDHYLKAISTPFSGGFFAYNRQYIERLPIRLIDFPKPADKAAHDRIVALVERMLEKHRRLAATKSESEKTSFTRLIAATDAEIDRVVYELYGLTAAEIKVVESA
jgi:hypothetical protein